VPEPAGVPLAGGAGAPPVGSRLRRPRGRVYSIQNWYSVSNRLPPLSRQLCPHRGVNSREKLLIVALRQVGSPTPGTPRTVPRKPDSTSLVFACTQRALPLARTSRWSCVTPRLPGRHGPAGPPWGSCPELFRRSSPQIRRKARPLLPHDDCYLSSAAARNIFLPSGLRGRFHGSCLQSATTTEYGSHRCPLRVTVAVPSNLKRLFCGPSNSRAPELAHGEHVPRGVGSGRPLFGAGSAGAAPVLPGLAAPEVRIPQHRESGLSFN